jgi:polyketide synthase 5
MQQLLAADAHSIEGPYGFTGNNFSMASGRIAYHLGVHGPAYSVDSACSSGLLALHLGCRSLHDGESDLVLAGGVNLVLEPRKLSSGSAQGMLSPTGHCHAFDAAADGFVPGEAAGVVLLKRLEDARRDGDGILAVVRGSAVNQDGHTVNIATPSRTAQVAVCKAALESGAVDPATIGLIEAHGTGTPGGDPIEFTSLAEVYGHDRPVALGSHKTNFGHRQSVASGPSRDKERASTAARDLPAERQLHPLSDELPRCRQSCSCWPAANLAAGRPPGGRGVGLRTVRHQRARSARGGPRRGRGWHQRNKPLRGRRPDLRVCPHLGRRLRRTAGRWRLGRPHAPFRPVDLAYTMARDGAPAGATRCSPTATCPWSPRYARSQTARDSRTRVRGRGDRGTVWVFSGRVRSGPGWVPACWPPNRTSRPPSPRSSR